LEGINVVDSSSSVMKDYLALTQNEELYGRAPYRIQGTPLLLRQTGCLQKFSVCRDWHLTGKSLPIALFEISDSYRHEPTDTLQLCSRTRRFRLPEMHIHTSSTKEAVALSVDIHRLMVDELSILTDDCQLLVSAPSSFASSNHAFFKELASVMGKPLLLKIYPPGFLCEDGIEVDVEYKIIDSMGYAREFSTFQIDELITKSFGLRYSSRGHSSRVPSTIHAVFTGSLERHLYFLLDRAAGSQGSGVPVRLPLWISPVVARVILSHRGSIEPGMRLARDIQSRGIRTDIDDRPYGMERKVEEANLELVPYQILLGNDPASRLLNVRTYGAGDTRRMTLEQLLEEVTCAQAEERAPKRTSLREIALLGRRPRGRMKP
jgi:threonyl-tRNA synthetase